MNTQRNGTGVGTRDDDVLRDDAPEHLRFVAFGDTNVVLDPRGLEIRRHEEVAGRYPDVVSIGVAPGDRGVTSSIHELVMVQIVRRQPGEHRVAVHHGNPRGKKLVGPLGGQRWPMHVVVCDDAGRNREVTAQRQQEQIPRGPRVLKRDEERD